MNELSCLGLRSSATDNARRYLSALLASLCLAGYSHAQEDQTVEGVPGDEVPRYFTFIFENDIFVGEDNGYTNGLGMTFGKGPFREFNEDTLPRWLLPLISDSYLNRGEGVRRGVAHTFFQRMQTPQDITLSEPADGDLPYAGLLGWIGTFYKYDEIRSDQFSVVAGIVGPASLAEQGQSIIHGATGSDQPEGWDTQLKNEPVGRVEAMRVQKLGLFGEGPRKWDILGIASAGLGTLQSGIGAGFAVRWGSNLDYTHSTFSLEANRQVNSLAIRESNGFYVYAGARADVFFNDVLVQGNTFTDSFSAELEHLQDQFSAGVVWSMGKLAYVFQLSTFSSRTEFTDEREKYGALSVTFRY